MYQTHFQVHPLYVFLKIESTYKNSPLIVVHLQIQPRLFVVRVIFVLFSSFEGIHLMKLYQVGGQLRSKKKFNLKETKV